ncbi:MAG: FAD-binding protein [Acholeplasmatales bacterium]|nr:MAG: FAD-binding protein [Acholeplasmatales bacterium]
MFELNLNTVDRPTAFDTDTLWDLLVVGGGPAGLNAALYARRKGLQVAVIAKDFGGQLHNTTDVDNVIGHTLVSGKALADKFLEHVRTLEVPMLHDAMVHALTRQRDGFMIELADGRTLHSKTVLIATGSRPRKLNIEGEVTYANKGVSYCTTCDAPFFKGKHVLVAGGGNSAAEAVIDLSHYARHITVVHRSQWRADQVLLDKLATLRNLTVHLETALLAVHGKDVMTGATVLDKATHTTRQLTADGLFIEIGTLPISEWVKDLVHRNERGEVVVDENQATSIPGLYAAGDVTNQPFKQIIIATAEGAKAALAITQYLNHKTKENPHAQTI